MFLFELEPIKYINCPRCGGEVVWENDRNKCSKEGCSWERKTNKRVACFGKYYIPEETAHKKENQHYQLWEKEGILTVTDGARTDFQRIEDDLEELSKKIIIKELPFDPKEASYLIQNIQKWALVKGSEFDYKNEDHRKFFNTVTTFAEAGKLDDLVQQIEGMGNIKGDDIKAMFPNDNFTSEQLEQKAKEKVRNLKEKAHHIAETRESIRTLFPSVSNDVANEISYQSSTIKDVDVRMEQLSNEIAKKSGIHVTKETLKDSEQKAETTKAINDYIKENPNDAEIKDQFKDLQKLLDRRDKFVERYKELVTPEGQTKLEKKIQKAEEKIVETAKKEAAAEKVNKTVTNPDGTTSHVNQDDKGNLHVTPVDENGNVTGETTIANPDDVISSEEVRTVGSIVKKLLALKDDESLDDPADVEFFNANQEAILQEFDKRRFPQKSELESKKEDIEKRRKEELNNGKVNLGDITLKHNINSKGNIENEIINNKTGEGVFQVITKEGKVVYAPIVGKDFVNSVSKFSGKSIEEQSSLIFSGIPLNEILNNYTKSINNKYLVLNLEDEIDLDEFDSLYKDNSSGNGYWGSDGVVKVKEIAVDLVNAILKTKRRK